MVGMRSDILLSILPYITMIQAAIAAADTISVAVEWIDRGQVDTRALWGELRGISDKKWCY